MMLAMTFKNGWSAGGWLVVTLALTTAGCLPRATEGDLESPDPAARLYAIRKAGQTGDRKAIPLLIESLDSDDTAVRLYAIQALRRITGRDLGYSYYAPVNERTAAADRWAEAWRRGELDERVVDAESDSRER